MRQLISIMLISISLQLNAQTKHIDMRIDSLIFKDAPDYSKYDLPDTNHVRPSFPGGMDSLYAFVKQQLNSTENLDFKGSIGVGFMVETDGTVTEAELLKGTGNNYDSTIFNIVKRMPSWNPGTINGHTQRLPGIILLKLKYLN